MIGGAAGDDLGGVVKGGGLVLSGGAVGDGLGGVFFAKKSV